MSPFKDPARRRQYNRDYAKKKANKGLDSEKNTIAELRKRHTPEKFEPFQLETVASLTAVLETVIDEVLAANMRPEVRARCISSLTMAALKTLELSDISQRLDRLEEKLLPAGGIMR
jgi:hypothetical protein